MSVGRAGARGARSPGGRGGSQEGDRSRQEAAEEEAPRRGLAQRPGLKDDALGKWRERSSGGRRAGAGSAGETAGGPGRGAADPPIASAPWPGAPGAGALSRRAGRRANGRWAAPGSSRPPAASPSPLPSLHPPSPPISRLPLSLRPPCPEARRAPPLPLGRAAGLLPAGVPAAARGAGRGFRRGGGRGVRGSFSWRRRGLASFPQRRPPSPKGKKLASPDCGAGRAGWCQQGCAFTRLKMAFKVYFRELYWDTFHKHRMRPGQLQWGGVCRFFWRRTGWPTRASGYGKP